MRVDLRDERLGPAHVLVGLEHAARAVVLTMELVVTAVGLHEDAALLLVTLAGDRVEPGLVELLDDVGGDPDHRRRGLLVLGSGGELIPAGDLAALDVLGTLGIDRDRLR
jgi:hypothetical protein